MSDKWREEMSDIFGLVFLLERKLEGALDAVLKPHNITTKQWFMLAVVEKLFEHKPSIREVARQLNTSHQNVKTIALNLQRRGFVTLERDALDRRITRLATTSQNKQFWQQREAEDKELIADLFGGLTNEEITTLHELLSKMSQRIDEPYGKTKTKVTEEQHEET